MTEQVLTKTQKIVRYEDFHGEIHYGTVENEVISQLSNSFLNLLNNELHYDSVQVRYNDVKVLTPILPSKIINFGWTYAEHARETGGTANLKEPFLFLKPSSSIIPDKGRLFSHQKD